MKKLNWFEIAAIVMILSCMCFTICGFPTFGAPAIESGLYTTAIDGLVEKNREAIVDSICSTLGRRTDLMDRVDARTRAQTPDVPEYARDAFISREYFAAERELAGVMAEHMELSQIIELSKHLESRMQLEIAIDKVVTGEGADKILAAIDDVVYNASFDAATGVLDWQRRH